MRATATWMLIPAIIASATPAIAASESRTRLVECRTGDCLLVTGRRDDRNAVVAINGRTVPVEGALRWEIRLPVDTLRAWSAPDARTVTISVDGVESEARLPTGMFVQPEQLTMLVIRVK